MAFYRVEFSEDWIKGRWGFTDRVFTQLKGRETEPSRLENAWLVNFNGSPAALGVLLSDQLNIQAKDFRRFGNIFQIMVLEADRDLVPKRPRTRLQQPRPAWERQE